MTNLGKLRERVCEHEREHERERERKREHEREREREREHAEQHIRIRSVFTCTCMFLILTDFVVLPSFSHQKTAEITEKARRTAETETPRFSVPPLCSLCLLPPLILILMLLLICLCCDQDQDQDQEKVAEMKIMAVHAHIHAYKIHTF